MLPQPAEISQLEFYRQRAQATRRRRQAAGRYARPTKAQQLAFAHSLQRDGRKSLTVEEMALLATHPYLAASQRAEYAVMAQAAVASVTLPPLQDYIDAGARLDAEVPPSHEERQDEAAHLCDTAAFYDWCKREALDLEEDLLDRMFFARGEW